MSAQDPGLVPSPGGDDVPRGAEASLLIVFKPDITKGGKLLRANNSARCRGVKSAAAMNSVSGTLMPDPVGGVFV